MHAGAYAEGGSNPAASIMQCYPPPLKKNPAYATDCSYVLRHSYMGKAYYIHQLDRKVDNMKLHCTYILVVQIKLKSEMSISWPTCFSVLSKQKEWICSLFKEWILEKSEIRVNLEWIWSEHLFYSLILEWPQGSLGITEWSLWSLQNEWITQMFTPNSLKFHSFLKFTP